MTGQQLSDRSAQLLNLIVDRYIRDGIPVGSKTLAKEKQVGLGATSIRNVMAELEERGLIVSPHTSAGRVPTALGYRLFVDSLVNVNAVGDDLSVGDGLLLTESLKQQLAKVSSPSQIAESASNILSDMTRQAGLVMLPRPEVMAFRQLEFVPLSEKRVLAIIVVNEEEVHNSVIQTEKSYTEGELNAASEFINKNYSGRSVDSVTAELLSSMEQDKSLIDSLMQDAIDFASQALQEVKPADSDYVVAGQANLLDESIDDMQRLRDLFEAFQQKKDILHLMQRCASGQGIQVFIGAESGYEVLDDFSVVTAPYQTGANTVGVLGVIGPTRMAYSKVVPMVDVTARLLSAALRAD